MLNPKQERFCQEYLVDLTASAAYKRAGYSGSIASRAAAASRLLTDVNIQARIAELKCHVTERNNLTIDKIIQQYKRIAFSNLLDLIEVEGDKVKLRDNLSADERSVIKSLSIKGERFNITLHDKLTALNFLAQYSGMTNDLNQAWKILENYGFERIKTERGYELIDTQLN